MASYTIKDLENLSGIKAHTIRVWEKRYSLVNPKRTASNIRTYDDDDLKKILNISVLNRNGIKISKIACMCEEELREKITLLSNDANDYASQIEKMIVAMIELSENKFNALLSRLVMQIGFENTFVNVIHPFFRKIGLMWQTGSINPAQEHFISNLVRQKLIVAIDSQVDVTINHNNTRFLLFLPEGELHELGLLYCSYLLKKHGYQVIYLGQSVPFEDLKNVQNTVKTDFLITTFFNTQAPDKMKKFVNNLSETFKNKNIVVFGGYPSEIIKNPAKNVQLLKESTDIQELLLNIK